MATLVPVQEPVAFSSQFQALTGYPPFQWQQTLYNDWFSQGRIPHTCSFLREWAKHPVIAIWLISLAT
jgi:hypothetical protein